jgi:transcriptional regulator with PAS, ATPase and Fis domain
MREIQRLLLRLAGHPTNILISGESGVGKEYAARYLHRNGAGTQQRPFIAVNCAALTETLLEAELFGHEKGAFTGAVASHRGIFEQAHGGTLFLDEVGEMSPRMQAKLLRAIEERKIRRVGGEAHIPVEVRLLCATNGDLQERVQANSFRGDLFFRINVIDIPIPPLRQRPQDIRWFAHRFIKGYADLHGTPYRLTAHGEGYLLSRPWPGNLRELQNTIERACILSNRQGLGPEELGAEPQETLPQPPGTGLKAHLEQCEAAFIRDSLQAHDGRISATAESLGISRKNLWEKMRRYGL